MKEKKRVVIIGLDGGDFRLLEKEFKQGRLPVLKNLITKGIAQQLKSTIPPLTFPAWASFATGVNPGIHGIFDFSEKIPGTYSLRFVNARWREMPCFWHYLSKKGYRTTVIGVPVTYPPEPLNGILICGFDAPGVGGGKLDRSSVYPPEFFDEFIKKFPDYWLGANVIEFGTNYEAIGERLLEVLKVRLKALLWLYQKENWDCFVGVIGETDAVCHYFWRFYDEESPFYTEKKGYLGKYITEVYELVDSFLRDLLHLLPEDAVLLIVSDHGMGPVGKTAIRLNSYLAQSGFLTFKRHSFSYRTFNQLKLWGLKYVPPRLKRFLFRQTNIANFMERKLRYGMIDWQKTIAFSEESPQFPSIYLNLQGREPKGIVSPKEYHRIGEEIKSLLKELKIEGIPLVKNVFFKEEVYKGSKVKNAPDLLIEWNYTLPYSPPIFLKSFPNTPSIEKSENFLEEFLLNRSACHRPEGIFILYGDQPYHINTTLHLEHIAPLVMKLLGEDLPTEISFSLDKTIFMTKEETAAIEEKLRSLGYL